MAFMATWTAPLPAIRQVVGAFLAGVLAEEYPATHPELARVLGR